MDGKEAEEMEQKLTQLLLKHGSPKLFLDQVFHLLSKHTDFLAFRELSKSEKYVQSLFNKYGHKISTSMPGGQQKTFSSSSTPHTNFRSPHSRDHRHHHPHHGQDHGCGPNEHLPKSVVKVNCREMASYRENINRYGVQPEDRTTSSSSVRTGSVASRASPKSGKMDLNEIVRSRLDDEANAYNGAVCSNYSWSQTISEIDVHIPVPKAVISNKHVRVFLSSSNVTVVVNGGGAWMDKMNGKFQHPIRTNNSLWTLHPGSHLHLYLEKDREAWWGSLISGEEQVDKGKVDRSVGVEDLTDEAQAMVQKLAYQQYLKHRRSISEHSTY